MDHHTDPGLCASMGGVIDLRGTAKTAWSLAAGALAPGQTTIDVTDATGWSVGDRLIVARTAAVSVASYSLAYDLTIAAVTGTTITLAEPLSNAHPVNISPSGEDSRGGHE